MYNNNGNIQDNVDPMDSYFTGPSNKKPEIMTSNPLDIFSDTEDVFDDIQKKREERDATDWGEKAILFLHALKFIFLFYSGFHNAHAAWNGAEGWGRVFQISGVVIVELAVGGIYMSAIKGKIPGKVQRFIALIVWVGGMTFMGLGIVADSQAVAGVSINGLAQWYLTTGIYLAPQFMIVGTALIFFTDPILRQYLTIQLSNANFDASMAKMRQDWDEFVLTQKINVAKIKMNALRYQAQQAEEVAKSEVVLNKLAENSRRSVFQEFGVIEREQALLQSAEPVPEPRLTQTQETRTNPKRRPPNYPSSPTRPTNHRHQPNTRTKPHDLDQLLRDMGQTREGAKELLGKQQLTNANDAYHMLKVSNVLPKGVSLSHFRRLFDELMYTPVEPPTPIELEPVAQPEEAQEPLWVNPDETDFM